MTQLSSALAFIPSANLRNMLTFFRDAGDAVAVRLIDTELFYRQPVVTRDCGYGHWMATRGDYDLDCLVGTGRTEAEAIDMLIDWEADHRARYDALPSPSGGSVDDGGMAEERSRHP